ncbi:MAG: PilN domain-containing protein [Nitrospinota bacterium]
MIKINLLADKHAKDRIRIQQQFIFATIVLLLTITGMIFWWQSLSFHISALNSDIQEAEAELQRQSAIRAEIKKMEEYRVQLEQIQDAIEKLLLLKAGPTIVLDTINVMLPKEIWLTNIDDVDGQLSLQGYSFTNPSVAKFMKNLEESDQFIGVNLLNIKQENIAETSLNKFNISLWTMLGKKLADEAAKLKAEAEAKNKK